MKRASLVLAFAFLAVGGALITIVQVARRSPKPTGLEVAIGITMLDPNRSTSGNLEAEQTRDDRSVLSETSASEVRAELDDPRLQAFADEFASRMTRASLAGQVVRQVGSREEPVSGAVVVAELEAAEITPPMFSTSSTRPAPARPAAVRIRTGEDGSFRLEDLTSGSYRLRAVLPTGEEKLASAQATHLHPTVDIRFVFGSATLSGIVRTTTGAPQSGADVLLSAQSPGGSGIPSASCSTDEAGVFRFGQLAAGRYTLQIDGHAEFPPPESSGFVVRSGSWPCCSCDLNVVEGDQLSLDVGAPGGTGSWRGSLRTPLGDRYGFGKVITARREWRSPLGSEVRMSFTCATRPAGEFCLLVPAGTWDLCVDFNDRDTWRAPAPVRIASADTDRDLVVPGTRISGIVLHEPAGVLSGPRRDSTHIRIRPFARSDDHDPDHECVVGADGTYRLLVRGSGDWVLSAEPFVFAGGRKTLDVQLPESESIHRLDLELQSR